ncbi:hypothetical protein [Anaerolinea sp.]|uniref:hypothetical protein n=1 Tax=Anaerolinea sp. TaxID=1872519 RepID=UPI002ACE8141|nr:hypothetical protein [Anaerolinea sp.]
MNDQFHGNADSIPQSLSRLTPILTLWIESLNLWITPQKSVENPQKSVENCGESGDESGMSGGKPSNQFFTTRITLWNFLHRLTVRQQGG